MNLKKIYRKFIFITDILFYFIISYEMLAEWYNRGMSSMSSMSWLLLGLLFFITGLRTMLKKPPIFVLLFKEILYKIYFYNRYTCIFYF